MEQSKTAPVRERTTETTIGKTTFIVTCSFSEKSRETAEQKLLRLISDHVSDALMCGEIAEMA